MNFLYLLFVVAFNINTYCSVQNNDLSTYSDKLLNISTDVYRQIQKASDVIVQGWEAAGKNPFTRYLRDISPLVVVFTFLKCFVIKNKNFNYKDFLESLKHNTLGDNHEQLVDSEESYISKISDITADDVINLKKNNNDSVNLFEQGIVVYEKQHSIANKQRQDFNEIGQLEDTFSGVADVNLSESHAVEQADVVKKDHGEAVIYVSPISEPSKQYDVNNKIQKAHNTIEKPMQYKKQLIVSNRQSSDLSEGGQPEDFFSGSADVGSPENHTAEQDDVVKKDYVGTVNYISSVSEPLRQYSDSNKMQKANQPVIQHNLLVHDVQHDKYPEHDNFQTSDEELKNLGDNVLNNKKNISKDDNEFVNTKDKNKVQSVVDKYHLDNTAHRKKNKRHNIGKKKSDQVSQNRGNDVGENNGVKNNDNKARRKRYRKGISKDDVMLDSSKITNTANDVVNIYALNNDRRFKVVPEYFKEYPITNFKTAQEYLNNDSLFNSIDYDDQLFLIDEFITLSPDDNFEFPGHVVDFIEKNKEKILQSIKNPQKKASFMNLLETMKKEKEVERKDADSELVNNAIESHDDHLQEGEVHQVSVFTTESNNPYAHLSDEEYEKLLHDALRDHKKNVLQDKVVDYNGVFFINNIEKILNDNNEANVMDRFSAMNKYIDDNKDFIDARTACEMLNKEDYMVEFNNQKIILNSAQIFHSDLIEMFLEKIGSDVSSREELNEAFYDNIINQDKEKIVANIDQSAIATIFLNASDKVNFFKKIVAQKLLNEHLVDEYMMKIIETKGILTESALEPFIKKTNASEYTFSEHPYNEDEKVFYE